MVYFSVCKKRVQTLDKNERKLVSWQSRLKATVAFWGGRGKTPLSGIEPRAT